MARKTSQSITAAIDRALQDVAHQGTTYLQLLGHGISTSPWKRVLECLRDDEALLKTPGKDGLVRWRVVKAQPLKGCAQ